MLATPSVYFFAVKMVPVIQTFVDAEVNYRNQLVGNCRNADQMVGFYGRLFISSNIYFINFQCIFFGVIQLSLSSQPSRPFKLHDFCPPPRSLFFYLIYCSTLFLLLLRTSRLLCCVVLVVYNVLQLLRNTSRGRQ